MITDRDMPRAYKNHIQEENILLQKTKGKNELTQKKKLFGPKYSLTSQVCCSAIWFWK